MELQDLIEIFNGVLNRDGTEPVTAETQFKDSDHWDSMSAFEVAERIHAKSGLRLKGIQIRKCSTIKELFDSLSI